MIEIGREVRNGSQPTSSWCGGPDVRVKDRPGRYSVNKKADLFAVGLRFPALCLPKASNEFPALPFPRGSANCFSFHPGRSVEHKPGQNSEPKSSVFPRSFYFLLWPWGPFETEAVFSNHTLHHHWVWEGSYLYWKRKKTILGWFIWKKRYKQLHVFFTSMVGGGANDKSYFGLLCYGCILLKINYHASK